MVGSSWRSMSVTGCAGSSVRRPRLRPRQSPSTGPRPGITSHIARRGTPHGSGLGVHRWAVEQTIALLHWFRRLRIRWEIRDDIHEAFMTLAEALVCFSNLTTGLC
jgi:hypothetical protein